MRTSGCDSFVWVGMRALSLTHTYSLVHSLTHSRLTLTHDSVQDHRVLFFSTHRYDEATFYPGAWDHGLRIRGSGSKLGVGVRVRVRVRVKG